MGGNVEIGGGAGTVDILGNVSTYSQYVGIAMTILFVLFIIVAVLASLWKRVTKNIFNVVIIALSCLATFFGSKIAIKQVLNIEAVKSFIADNLLSIEIFQGSSVAFIEAAAIALVTVIVTPILYCIIHAIIKAVCYLISLCIPPFRRLMKRKIDGQPVRITAGARIVSACLGVVVGCFSYFMICMPVFSLTNLATGIINELPIEAIMESEQEESASLGGATLYSAGSQEGGEQTGESSASLKSTLQMVGSVSKAISPFSDSLMFKMYGGLGINKLVQNYADNVSALDYEVDGMHYTTKGFSDLTNVGKGAVILGSYIVCEMDKESFPENPIDLTKLQDGIYYVLGNNVIIDTADCAVEVIVGNKRVSVPSFLDDVGSVKGVFMLNVIYSFGDSYSFIVVFISV